MGEHGLDVGKQTAFETDIHVPLVISGPGIAPGRVNRDITQNIDLAPTFEQLARTTPPPSVDGRSLVPLLRGETVPWRTVALVEHRGPDLDPADPDRQPTRSGDPPSYEALRSSTFTYVSYRNGGHEYYDRTTDPYEMHNIYSSLTSSRVAKLNATLHALTTCRGTSECSRAARTNSG